MKFKKLASLLIAGAMLFSMAMPAFASDFSFGSGSGSGTSPSGSDATTTGSDTTSATSSDTDLNRSLRFVGVTNVPTIKVTMPAQASIILNPFALKVGDDESTDPFISDTVHLTNESNCKIAVSGSFTPSVTGKAKLVDTPAKADTGTSAKLSTGNNVFVCAAVAGVAAEDTELDFKDSLTYTSTARGVSTAATATKYDEKVLGAWDSTLSTAAKNFLKNKTADTDYGLYVLKTADTAVAFGDSTDAAKFDKTDAAAKLPYVLDAGDENPTYLAMRLYGICETKVATPWAAEDTVSVSMVLTLVPYAN